MKLAHDLVIPAGTEFGPADGVNIAHDEGDCVVFIDCYDTGEHRSLMLFIPKALLQEWNKPEWSGLESRYAVKGKR